jgi:hypoxanthine phosphoribosyltransferase
MGIEAAAGCDDLACVLLTEEQIQARVSELAAEIARDYAGQRPLLIGILKGAFVFLSDLMRRLSFPLEVDFVCCASYGQAANSSGELELLKGPGCPLAGRHILIVEDIVDTGLTLAKLVAMLGQEQPASLKICCLLSKPSRRETEIEVHYTGFEIPDEFVVGYGLDYAERYRWLPHVAVVKPETYGTT